MLKHEMLTRIKALEEQGEKLKTIVDVLLSMQIESDLVKRVEEAINPARGKINISGIGTDTSTKPNTHDNGALFPSEGADRDWIKKVTCEPFIHDKSKPITNSRVEWDGNSVTVIQEVDTLKHEEVRQIEGVEFEFWEDYICINNNEQSLYICNGRFIVSEPMNGLVDPAKLVQVEKHTAGQVYLLDGLVGDDPCHYAVWDGEYGRCWDSWGGVKRVYEKHITYLEVQPI